VAFGIKRAELNAWKEAVARGETAYLTHYWYDPRFPEYRTVTKVGNSDLGKLFEWCIRHGLNPRYIHNRPPFPHFDLIGPKQTEILLMADLMEHVQRFKLDPRRK
jgi:hypothetical protein